MEIGTEKVNEIHYNELINEERDIEEGDILLIKKDKSNEWVAQFVTIITHIGIYLHSENDGLDGGGVILWPEYIKEQNLPLQELYNNAKFIHIPIKDIKE